MNWQSENVLLYSARYERRHLAWRRLAEVLPHLPFLIRDNHSIGRDVVLAGDAAARVAAAYGLLLPMVPDDGARVTLAGRAAQIARGTPYVLTLLEPTPDEHLDTNDFDAAVMTLAGAAAPTTKYGAFPGLGRSRRRTARLPLTNPTAHFAEPSRFLGISSRCGWNRGCHSRRSAERDSVTCCADVSMCSPSSVASVWSGSIERTIRR
jgi:hypothetical protein